MEGRHHLRADQHPRAALFGRREQKPQIPPPSRRGRGPDQVPAHLRQVRQGSHLGRHRQGLRVSPRTSTSPSPRTSSTHSTSTRSRPSTSSRSSRSKTSIRSTSTRPTTSPPRPPGLKAYRLLADALEAEGQVGVAKVASAGQRAPRHDPAQGRRLRPRDHALARRDSRAAEFEELDKKVEVRDSRGQDGAAADPAAVRRVSARGVRGRVPRPPAGAGREEGRGPGDHRRSRARRRSPPRSWT